VKIEQRRKLVRVGRSQPLHLASGFIIKGIRFRLCGRLQVMPVADKTSRHRVRRIEALRVALRTSGACEAWLRAPSKISPGLSMEKANATPCEIAFDSLPRL